MIQRYAFVFALSALSLSSFTQGLVVLTDEEGHTVNGTVITAPCGLSTDTVSLFARLSGSSATEVNVRRYEMWPVAGSSNFYCWGVCYLSVTTGTFPTWVSQHPVSMNPNATYNNFHSYYQATGNPGTARFRFVWFDLANPNGADSSWVDIDYCGLVGINTPTTVVNNLSTWPNPTLGQDIQVDYALDRAVQGAELVLYTVLGERIRRTTILAAQGRLTIPAGTLATGVYFANIERNGRILATRKVVVAR